MLIGRSVASAVCSGSTIPVFQMPRHNILLNFILFMHILYGHYIEGWQSTEIEYGNPNSIPFSPIPGAHMCVTRTMLSCSWILGLWAWMFARFFKLCSVMMEIYHPARKLSAYLNQETLCTFTSPLEWWDDTFSLALWCYLQLLKAGSLRSRWSRIPWPSF
jgi:hypothetical protein